MLAIPRATVYTIQRGEQSAAAFAIQRVCNKFGYACTEDGDFGLMTASKVKLVQARLHVEADGVFGTASQRALALFIATREETASNTPPNLILSQINYESGGMLAAVNWGTPGGVDCGITQRRVYDYQIVDDVAVKRAFDPFYQATLLSDSLRSLHDSYMARAGVKRNNELAWRLAVLNHNYPAAADIISVSGIGGLSSYWTHQQSWVSNWGLKFPDGHLIQTPLEWCQRYSLGNSQHNEPGQAVKLVRDWA